MIRTQLHKALALLPPSSLRTALERDPIFVFEDEITRLLVNSDSSTKSLSAMAEAGLIHLPYPRMTVQFRTSSGGWHWFINIEEREIGFQSQCIWLDAAGKLCGASRPINTRVSVEAFEVVVNENNANSDNYAFSSAIGLKMAVLMSHVSGLEREEIEPSARLNAAREKKDKPTIRAHTYVHIAKVYDSSGNAHTYTGRRMPVHMRAGHIRRQHYGKDRAETKLIWIPPVMVNYDSEAPQIEKRVIK